METDKNHLKIGKRLSAFSVFFGQVTESAVGQFSPFWPRLLCVRCLG